ncbi:ABC transporter substrate-binding protein [Actinomadura madurae]|uniref:ABC transporter substrate-binding protein n=1 Tax=Actinomadura madurae TaxID=1993 RepID=UPI0020D241AA|nr:sugar ABC transporter substrate-binding protein [Actinomadura madurae]MCP9948028.1 sugar ABC transporter substrate-binding protein [Actinomadura madurae]MCP9964797.1 sugar ABC transporter substrate-binding protein [Actinomadura madurae]MCP9977281.1 sugar ABC transporter substrate-binding protein [Actinomadura madurae]MCQ0013469.1 sugar ABC transporter substrate-binding protein [Actinomadura madurae]
MKKHSLRTAAATAAALAVLAPMAACSSKSPGSGGGDAKNAKIAFLMPDIASTRYELYDAPLFKAKTKELCGGCTVLYQNAGADASKQQQQASSVLAQGAKVIVIDPVDSAAAASIVRMAQSRDVKVIAYDRPIPAAKADYYVSFDNEKIGALIGQSLVDHLKKEKAEGGILEVNGSPTDAAANLIKKGIHSAVDPSGFKLLAEYDTPGWEPAKAQAWVSGQISKYRGQIAGVVAANDGTGGGAIAAFKAVGVDVPPVTGNDAELAAAQRIIAGDQYNTISKPIKIVAEAAANAAHAFVQGETPKGNTTLFGTPSELFTPTVVTKDNIGKVLLGPDGALKTDKVCTAEYAAACAKLGLQ